MEKIIFLVFAAGALAFVIYLGGNAIMTGFKAKSELKRNKGEDGNENMDNQNSLTNELSKLNELHENGTINAEDFEKAKKKILGN